MFKYKYLRTWHNGHIECHQWFESMDVFLSCLERWNNTPGSNYYYVINPDQRYYNNWKAKAVPMKRCEYKQPFSTWVFREHGKSDFFIPKEKLC